MDFNEYRKEFYKQTHDFFAKEELTHYELPNSHELHNMICGYRECVFEDRQLFDTIESIDYLKYEKELWKLERLD